MPLDTRDVSDINRYYASTYLRIKHKGTWTPLYLREVSSSGIVHGSVVENGKWTSFESSYDSLEINFNLPELGYAHIKNHSDDKIHAVYISLFPDRQWKKGICDRILTYNCDYLGKPQAWGISSAEHMVGIMFPEYYPYTMIDNMPETHQSIALSRNLAIAKDPKSDAYWVLYKGSIVGYKNQEDNTAVISRSNRHLTTYISKYIPCEVEQWQKH